MKNKALRKIATAVMAAVMVMGMGVTAFADITSSGGSGTAVMEISSVPAAFSVTVPTTLPVEMDAQGETTVADNVYIVNNSYGPVRVKSCTVTPGPGWSLVTFGDKSTIAGEKVNSCKAGIQIKLGEGTAHGTSGTESTQALFSAPENGCYMSGCENAETAKTHVGYDAIISASIRPNENITIANVVFVVEWDM